MQVVLHVADLIAKWPLSPADHRPVCTAIVTDRPVVVVIKYRLVNWAFFHVEVGQVQEVHFQFGIACVGQLIVTHDHVFLYRHEVEGLDSEVQPLPAVRGFDNVRIVYIMVCMRKLIAGQPLNLLTTT